MWSTHYSTWILTLFLFIFVRHWLSARADEDLKCSCARGCNFSQYCIPANDCRKENVALGRPAEMSSSWGPDYPSGPACQAVNGNTGTEYIPENTSFPTPNCVHTQENDRNAWWLVKLDRNYTITDITLYIRKIQPERVDRVRITVDDEECYTLPNGTTSTPEFKNISCKIPLAGSVIKLSKNGTGQTDSGYLLSFCEVQVWVCRSGFYGKNCEHVCNCKYNATCDNYFGTCSSGCYEGYHGLNCSQRCGNCNNMSMCDSTSGHCLTGCQTGWREPLCQVCKSEFYGATCSSQCGKCLMGSNCNISSGVCPDGCDDGYLSPLCTQNCPLGKWGKECTNNCGACSAFACRHDNGSCEMGCFSGFEGAMCKEMKEAQDQTGTIVGSALGGSLIIGGSVIIAVLICLRRFRMAIKSTHSRMSNDFKPQENGADADVYENQALENIQMELNVYDKPDATTPHLYSELSKEKPENAHANKV